LQSSGNAPCQRQILGLGRLARDAGGHTGKHPVGCEDACDEMKYPLVEPQRRQHQRARRFRRHQPPLAQRPIRRKRVPVRPHQHRESGAERGATGRIAADPDEGLAQGVIDLQAGQQKQEFALEGRQSEHLGEAHQSWIEVRRSSALDTIRGDDGCAGVGVAV
jgi:hypothetical protein